MTSEATTWNGVLLVNKPSGCTSHDIVEIARKRLENTKIGHAGTLDPMATGLLILLVGDATKLSNQYLEMEKQYEFTLKLGKETDTLDAEGKEVKAMPVPTLTKAKIDEIVQQFRGVQQQTPPKYSAVKVAGKPAYEYAREGQEVELAPRQINIHSISVADFIEPDTVRLWATCSGGTYVRKLGADIAEKLGTCGHVTQLHRYSIGMWTIQQSVSIDHLKNAAIRMLELHILDADPHRAMNPRTYSVFRPENEH